MTKKQSLCGETIRFQMLKKTLDGVAYCFRWKGHHGHHAINIPSLEEIEIIEEEASDLD